MEGLELICIKSLLLDSMMKYKIKKINLFKKSTFHPTYIMSVKNVLLPFRSDLEIPKWQILNLCYDFTKEKKFMVIGENTTKFFAFKYEGKVLYTVIWKNEK